MTSLYSPLRSRRSAVAVLLLTFYLPACTSWHVGQPTPEAFINREHPRTVKVKRVDGSSVVLSTPVIRGDSLTGVHHGSDNPGDTTRVTLPLSQVQTASVEKFSAGKGLLIIGGTLGVLLIVWVISCGNKSGWEAIGCP